MARSLDDLSGKMFGRLEVISRVENDKYGHPRWSCRCICGNMTNVASQGLKTGQTKSCGCWKSLRAKRRNIRHLRRNKPDESNDFLNET